MSIGNTMYSITISLKVINIFVIISGDIDSDADWISRSPPPSYHTYEPPTYHNDYTSSYLPELVLSSNASRVNGKKAETQL